MTRDFTNERRCGASRAPAWRRLGLALGGAAAVWLAVSARAATFTASLDRQVITLGESASLSLTFVDGEPTTWPAIPAIANLQVAYLGPSKMSTDINGRVTSTSAQIYSVSPRQPGDFTIPALQANVGGQILTTPPLKLTVLRPSAPPADAANAATQLAFLRLVLPKKEVYTGEILLAELQFYYRQGTQLAGAPQITALPADGFSVGKIVGGQQRQVRVGDAVFTILPALAPLTATRTGALSFGPVTATVVLELPTPGRRRNSFFEQFGLRDPFGGEQRQFVVGSDTEAVRSLPLPTQNVPASFNGAVGSFEMTVSAGPTNVAVGDPITVKVQLTGRGTLELLTLPEQSAWKDFRTYPAKTELKLGDQLGVQGTKFFEQVVAPQNADVKELPPFEFSFFDPARKEYRTLKQPAVALTVRPTATAAPVVAAGKAGPESEAPPPTRDLLGLKQHLGTLASAPAPLALRPWFWAGQGVPLLAWVGAVVWRKRADALARNPRLRRRKQVAQLVSDGLADLRRLAAENQADDFFATLVRVLQEQIGERLDLPASSITEAVVEERLKPAGLAEAACAALHELFQACNLARYAPVRTSQELAALVARAEEVIAQLRRFEA